MKKTGVKNTTNIQLSTKAKLLYAAGISAFFIAIFSGALLYFNLGTQQDAKADVSFTQFSSSLGAYTSITSSTPNAVEICDDNVGNSGSTRFNDEVFNDKAIGFTFKYDGTDYTRISISNNGFIAMGTSVINTFFPISSSTSSNNVISALGADLRGQNNSSIRTLVSGASPNRILTIQWDNYKFNGANDGEDNLDFQIKLFETTNKIQFVYGPFTKNTDSRSVQVGLRGTSSSDFYNRTTQDDWSSTTAGSSNTAACKTVKEVRLSGWSQTYVDIIPDNGLTYTFTQQVLNLNADLTLNIAASDINPCIGATVVYTVNIANNGPDGISNIAVTSAVPTGLTFQNSTSSSGSYVSGTGKWTIPSLANGASATLTITATVNSSKGGSSINSTASVTAMGGIDSNTSNNSSSIEVAVKNNTLPTISAIDDISTTYNKATDIVSFTVSDGFETAASALTVTASSSNTYLVPNTNITLGGSGTFRNFKITPGNNQSGTSIITVTVSDGTCIVERTFKFITFRQSYTSWQAANVVVGQSSFTTVDTVRSHASKTIAFGSNNTAVSSKGVLAVGSQLARRVLLWNSVPTTDGVGANFVIGKSNFTTTTQQCSQTATSNIDGVAFSPDGNKLIVSDAGNHRILIYNSIPTSDGKAADVLLGQTSWTSNSPGCSNVKFNRPTELLVTPSGKLLAVDRNNNRILIWNKIPTENNTPADNVIGQTDFTSNSEGTTANKLRLPWNCSLAPDGKLLVADNDNNRVLIFASVPTSNGASAINVIGQTDLSSRSTGASKSELNYIAGVSVSPNGMVAIADFKNNRVLIYNSVPTQNGEAADIVLGQPSFTATTYFNNGNNVTGNPSARNMYEPYGINYDLNERLFVNGRGMHRVMIFGEKPTQTTDLSVNFTRDIGTPCLGTDVTYSVNIKNNGPSEATNVVVNSALPNGFTLKSFSAQAGLYNAASGFWSIPLVNVGETVSLSVTGTVNLDQANASITAYANVRSNNQFDNNFSNNAASTDIKVANNTVPQLSVIDDQVMDINSLSKTINFTVNDAQTVIVTASSSNTTVIPNGNIVVAGTGVNRTVKITPAADQTGTVVVTINATDGSCGSSKTFKVNVGNIWLGYTTDWDTKSNWTSTVPTSTLSASIPSAPVGGQYPVINSTAEAKAVIIDAGASLTVNPTRVLNLYGDFTNHGTSFTGTGHVNFIAPTVQNIRGYIGDMKVNNANGVNLNGDVNCNGTMIFTNGNLTIGANTLTVHKPITSTTGSVKTSTTSSLTIDGTSTNITVPSNITELKRLTVSNSNGAVLSGNLAISDSLKLLRGALFIGSNSLTINKALYITAGKLAGTTSSNLILNGTGSVSGIAFIDGFQNVGNLTVNRPGKIVLASDLVVANDLRLSEGIIKTNTHKITVLNPSENAISAYGPTSYIEGNLRRYVNSSGNYNLPVGAEIGRTTKRDLLQLAQIEINASSNISYLDATFTFDDNSLLDNPIAFGSATIQGVLDNGYWTITPNNDNSYSVDYNIILNAQGQTIGATDPGNQTIIKRHNSSDSWKLAGVHNSAWTIGSGLNPVKVVRKFINSFSEYRVAYSETVLPVELDEFSGTYENKTVKLTWTTNIEVNNDHFDIERSIDGIDFSKIGEVKGNGNTTAKTSYNFVDRNILAEKLYYRLKQVDFNGDENYSNVVFVQAKVIVSNQLALEIYPNPTSVDNINISLSSPEKTQKFNLQLIDVQGRILHTEVINGIKAGNSFKINPSGNLTPKVYYIKVQQGGATVTKELIIKE